MQRYTTPDTRAHLNIYFLVYGDAALSYPIFKWMHLFFFFFFFFRPRSGFPAYCITVAEADWRCQFAGKTHTTKRIMCAVFQLSWSYSKGSSPRAQECYRLFSPGLSFPFGWLALRYSPSTYRGTRKNWYIVRHGTALWKTIILKSCHTLHTALILCSVTIG